MRYKIISLIIVLLIIPFVSANVRISKTDERPVFEVTLRPNAECTTQFTSGNTYYWQGVISDYRYNMGPVSPASIEYSVTPNATHGCINLSWVGQCDKFNYSGYAGNGIYYGALFRYSDGISFTNSNYLSGYINWDFNHNDSGYGASTTDQYGLRQWTGRFGNAGNPQNSFRCTSSNEFFVIGQEDLYGGGTDSSASSGYVNHPEIAMGLSDQEMIINNGFNMSKGILEICLTTGSTHSTEDVVQALIDSNNSDMFTYWNAKHPASSSYLTGNSILTVLGTFGYSTTKDCSGTLDAKEEIIITVFGNTYNRNANHEDVYIVSYAPDRAWWTFWGNYDSSNMIYIGGSGAVLDNTDGTLSNVGIKSFSVNGLTHYRNYDGWVFNNNVYHQTRYVRGSDVHQNSIFTKTYDYPTPSLTYLNETLSFINNSFFNDGWNNYDYYYSFAYIDNCYDNEWNIWDMYNIKTNRENGVVKHYFLAETTAEMCGYNGTWIHHSDSNIKVLNSTGEIVVGANITITDSKGNIDTILTDSNGEGTLDIENYRITPIWDVGNNYGNTVFNAPHNLTITYGDLTYNSILNLTESVDLILTIKETVDDTGTCSANTIYLINNKAIGGVV